MTDSAAGGERYAARRRRRAASRVERGRENSSSRLWARKAAGGETAAVVVVVVKGRSRESDARARPRRPRDMGMAGGELGLRLGRWRRGGSRGELGRVPI